MQMGMYTKAFGKMTSSMEKVFSILILGTYHYPDGSERSGEWKLDVENNGSNIYLTIGVFQYNDIEESKIDAKGNLETDLAIFEYVNGDKYEGKWDNKERNGHGT